MKAAGAGNGTTARETTAKQSHTGKGEKVNSKNFLELNYSKKTEKKRNQIGTGV